MDLAGAEERKRWLAWLAGWIGILLVAIAAYWPGLVGPFVFDDLSNVSKLGDLGGVRNWDTFKAFVFGGTSGPTGRPLSLLTFLIDAQNWPADSWPFKRTNLVIHLLTGVTLGVLTQQILAALKFERNAALWVSLVSAGCWLLHPFLVSTTLYVVQRMAQLSTLFVFAGLAGYVYGRRRIVSDPAKAYVVMSLSLAAGTILSMLCKENGILLPLLAGVIELTIFAHDDSSLPRPNRAWLSLFIVIPAAVIFLYLGRLFFVGNIFEIVPPREFSIFERLLTEPRVVADYLQNWFIPKLYTTGIFQDHFLKSTGLLEPLTTLFAILLHAALIALAFVKRRRWPLVSLAILFFYAGHLLESTVVSLELYFEHRNYLPACFLFLPLIALLWERANLRTFSAVAMLTLALLASFTAYSATVWASYESMVASSAHKAPTSQRAQVRYAANLFNAGRVDEALDRLDVAIETLPGDRTALRVSRIIYLCHLERLDQAEFDRVATTLSGLYYDPRMINIYRELTLAVAERHCPSVSVGSLRDLYKSMLATPTNSDPESIGYSQLKYYLGFVLTYADEPGEAVIAFEESLTSRPGASTAMKMAALLATNGHFHEALHVSGLALQQLESRGASALRGPMVSEADIKAFQTAVLVDMAAQQDAGSVDVTE